MRQLVCFFLFGLLLTIPAGAQAQIAQEAPRNVEEHPLPVVPPARSTMIFRELSNTLEMISSQSGRAVVQIFARGYTTNDDSTNTDTLLTSQRSSGSGVVLTPDGFILTNAHVVKGARNLRVELPHPLVTESEAHSEKLAGRSIPARVVGVDRQTDLAVIKIDRENLPYLEFG